MPRTFPSTSQRLDVDLLLCSAYKFYGPHVGILYAREGILDGLDTDRLRTQDQQAPYRIETGTLNHAAIAGVREAVRYIAALGHGSDLRSRIMDGMQNLGRHERALGMKLYQGLKEIPRVNVWGQSFDVPRRAPTVSFTMDGKKAAEVSTHLAERGICTWDGHFYAIRPMEVMGLLDRGGVTRVGISLYTTDEEVTRLLDEVRCTGKVTGGHENWKRGNGGPSRTLLRPFHRGSAASPATARPSARKEHRAAS